ncbi:uracil-DNA glycosylase family protein [Lacticaseibacillus chiayiensis]|uniref:uracil-DNA glycosylase family protein n=1 Tax=Lacticaseibacillus chiayiensis TaxID=2100821 RepID=UPI003C72FDF9
MDQQETFANKVLAFNESLKHVSIDLPRNYRIVNPFSSAQKNAVNETVTAFYKKYFDDTKPRRLILGSSPARRGTAVTGVPFEDEDELKKETGITINEFRVNRGSSSFLYDVMDKYGGKDKFYKDFFLSFVCPLGLIKINEKGNEVNCNYYENRRLQQKLLPFIVNSLRFQIKFGVDTEVCYCIGSGENYKTLNKINQTEHFFKSIVPLEHPRYIMQYNFKNKDFYMGKYISALNRP